MWQYLKKSIKFNLYFIFDLNAWDFQFFESFLILKTATTSKNSNK